MINRIPGRIQLLSLQLLALVLHHQWQVSQSAGLRGQEQEWRTSLMEKDSNPGGTLLIQPPSVALGEEETPPLICPFDPSSHCTSTGANRTTPVCEYNGETLEYTTLCWKSSLTSFAALSNPHPKSYCGACRVCFQDKEELQAAVDQYKSYKRVNVDLASKYGWPIGQWCVENVTSFAHLFWKKSKFNEDISNWQTSQVTDMTATFQNAHAFNQPLNTWDTSNVKSMTRMFAMAIHFDQDISSWNVESVEEMGYMFLHALEFDQDISDWQVHNAVNLNSMFFGATRFRQELLEKWQISEDADTQNMCEWNQQRQAQQT